MFKKLVQMAEVIAWLDSARWSTENQRTVVWGPPGLSSPSQDVLVHWLTNITNIQRTWQYVWRIGQKIFVEIVKAFSTHDFDLSEDIADTRCEVTEFLDTFRGEQEPKKVRPFLHGEIEYRPRFPNQHNSIERTLTILAHRFDRNFVKFTGESIKKWSHSRRGMHYVARDLFFLTYSDYPLQRTLELFDGDADYPRWEHYRYKRLWAAVRDYRKARNYLHLFHQGLMEAFGRVVGEQLFDLWTTTDSFRVYLLELPGDIWNIEFLKRLVIPLAMRHGINIKKSWGASKIAREIYDSIGSKEIYPEQLDVSWDLSAIACENGLCDICPFSKHNLEKVCLADVSGAKNRYCPIALAICQYRSICDPDNCPVAKKKGIGLCEGCK